LKSRLETGFSGQVSWLSSVSARKFWDDTFYSQITLTCFYWRIFYTVAGTFHNTQQNVNILG